MRGKMIWFNIDKGYGYIRTEDDERLYVSRSGFVPEHVPSERCANRDVTFERRDGESGPEAFGVVFAEMVEPRRARLRHTRRGSAL